MAVAVAVAVAVAKLYGCMASSTTAFINNEITIMDSTSKKRAGVGGDFHLCSGELWILPSKLFYLIGLLLMGIPEDYAYIHDMYIAKPDQLQKVLSPLVSATQKNYVCIHCRKWLSIYAQ